MADVNAVDENKSTALRLAQSQGNTFVAHFQLICFGAEIDEKAIDIDKIYKRTGIIAQIKKRTKNAHFVRTVWLQ